MLRANAPIIVVPHPPRLVVGGDYEGGLTPAACPLGGAFVELLLTFAHLCSTDLMRRELDNCPVQIPYLLPTWEGGA